MSVRMFGRQQHALEPIQCLSKEMTGLWALVMIDSIVPMCTMSQTCIYLCLHTYY